MAEKKIVRTDVVRRKIEKAIEAAEEERKKKLLATRLEIARVGLVAFKSHQYPVAIKSYFTYLKIIEEVKSVGQGGLLPSHFDVRTEMAELLMISGVYWDLTKIFDRVKGDQRNFQHFMEKYIQFSKGMPYQTVCTESLRKYIAQEKPVHRDSFGTAYRMLSGNRCFIATSLVDLTNDQTVLRLRAFRDQVLRHFDLGRSFIRWYYRNGPGLALQVDRFPQPVRKAIAFLLDRIAQIVSYLS